MSSPAIQAALSQMQSMATQAGSDAAKGQQLTASVGQGGFASELHDSILRINQMKQASDAKLAAFQAGDPNVALNDVMVDMQKASVAFEMGVQVRNRLVTAYKDIMNMQV
nr:flagellar hook-basal body complex protein FliE [uncultured Halomonas sp.]